MNKRHSDKPRQDFPAAFSEWVASKRPILKFGLLFGLLLGAFYIASSLLWWNQMLFLYLKANAFLSHLLLNLTGQQTEVHDLVIRSGDFGIAVRRGCDAIEPAWLFTAAVIAFPLPWRKKAWGVLMGVAFLLALNFIRIVSLFFIGKYLPHFFATAHLEIWPAAFVLSAVILWAVWLRWARRDEIPSR